MKKLDIGAKWMFRVGTYWAMIFLAVFFGGLLIMAINLMTGMRILILILSYTLVSVVIGEIYAKLAYDNFSYEFTDTNLKIERGIIWKRYSNVPYERVQNVDILRGIIARACGFSTVTIQTAGYAGGRGMGTEGYLPAVSSQEAEKIRDFLMNKIKKGKRNQGL